MKGRPCGWVGGDAVASRATDDVKYNEAIRRKITYNEHKWHKKHNHTHTNDKHSHIHTHTRQTLTHQTNTRTNKTKNVRHEGGGEMGRVPVTVITGVRCKWRAAALGFRFLPSWPVALRREGGRLRGGMLSPFPSFSRTSSSSIYFPLPHPPAPSLCSRLVFFPTFSLWENIIITIFTSTCLFFSYLIAVNEYSSQERTKNEEPQKRYA